MTALYHHWRRLEARKRPSEYIRQRATATCPHKHIYSIHHPDKSCAWCETAQCDEECLVAWAKQAILYSARHFPSYQLFLRAMSLFGFGKGATTQTRRICLLFWLGFDGGAYFGLESW